MNELERRLQRAATDIRSLEIEPPPFESLAPGRPVPSPVRRPARLAALVVPALFVVGGLAVLTAAPLQSSGWSDTPGHAVADAPAAAAGAAAAGTDRGLTPREEVQLIASLGGDAGAPADGSAPAPPLLRYR